MQTSWTATQAGSRHPPSLSDVVRSAPRLLGVVYLLGAALGAGLFLGSRNGLAGHFGLDPHLVNGQIVFPLTVWTAVGIGLLLGRSWAAFLSLMGFPIVAITSAWVGVDLTKADELVRSLHPVMTWWPLAGRVPFEVAARALSGAPLQTLTPSPWAWWFYTANAAFLSPVCLSWFVAGRIRLRALRGRRERNRRLRLPAEPLGVYESNAYQVLGLLPDAASTRKIMRRRGEIETLLAVQMPLTEHLASFFRVRLGSEPRLDATAASTAVSRLQDEPDRMAEELLWFRLDGEAPSVLKALKAGDLDVAESAWTARYTSPSTSPADRGAALTNLAVLEHARVLAKERALATPAAVANPQAWSRALALWREVYEKDCCWEHFVRRKKRATDPRVNDLFIRSLRHSLPARILGINLELARAATLQGHDAYARAQLELVIQSGFDCVDQIIAAFLEPSMAPVRRLLKPFRTWDKEILEWKSFAPTIENYEELRAPIVLLGGRALLRQTVDEAITATARSIKAEINASFNQFSEADMAWWKGTGALIEEWNFYTNQLAARPFLQAQVRDKCRDVLRRMRGLKSIGDSAREHLRSVRRMKARVRRPASFLSAIAQDASDDLAKEGSGIVEEASTARSTAEREYTKTRYHYNKNLNRMAYALQ